MCVYTCMHTYIYICICVCVYNGPNSDDNDDDIDDDEDDDDNDDFVFGLRAAVRLLHHPSHAKMFRTGTCS